MAKHDPRPEQVLVRSGAAIYAAAAVIVAIEAGLPGGPRVALTPAFAAVLVAAATLLVGPRLPRHLLLVLSPLGTGLIAYGLVHGAGYSDAAILYSWPTPSGMDCSASAWATAIHATVKAVARLP